MMNKKVMKTLTKCNYCHICKQIHFETIRDDTLDEIKNRITLFFSQIKGRE